MNHGTSRTQLENNCFTQLPKAVMDMDDIILMVEI